MSSFFTIPASQKKRKRIDAHGTASAKRNRGTSSAEMASRRHEPERPRRDESISGSESSDHESLSDARGSDVSTSSFDNEDATGAEKRLRLAERYLANIKGEVDEPGFDAAEVDRDLIAERLNEDVAGTKGRLYRFIASNYDFSKAVYTRFRMNTNSATTSIATCPPYFYTASKDLSLQKWELIEPKPPPLPPTKSVTGRSKRPSPKRRRPKQLICRKGSPNHSNDTSYRHHTGHILCVVASSDGRFVATGGTDRRLIIWSAADLTVLRVFTQHRDAITSLAFRHGTNQLYSSSADRTIKTWSLNELAYVETLFGHQDQVVDVAALGQERCLSAGARDRTVRLWKVVEETQLVFRGGGGGGGGGGDHKSRAQLKRKHSLGFAEGSIDRVAFIDDETFITGSDNGSLSLWSMHKKKPVYTLSAVHGSDPPLTPEEAFAEINMDGRKVPSPPEPRWITALKVIPYSDLVLTGSWDGWIKVWKITSDRKKFEFVGLVGQTQELGMDSDAISEFKAQSPVQGVINDIEVFEWDDKGKGGLCIVAALGREHRLGRWKKIDGKNGAAVFEVPKVFDLKDQATRGG